MVRSCFRLLGWLLVVTAFTGCGQNDEPTRQIDFVPLSSLEIVSQNSQAAAGTTNRFTAIGHYGNPATFQFTRDLTSQVTWASTNPAVLTVSNDPALAGLASAGVAGTATVTATLGASHTDLDFTVSAATISSLSITPPASTSLHAGDTLQLQATGAFSDGTSQDLNEAAVWSSSAADVATVGDAVPGKGLVTAVAVGTVAIAASFGGTSATQAIDVTAAALQSIVVTAEDGNTVAAGTTTQLTATGTYSDGSTEDLTDQATWASSLTRVAKVDQDAGTHGLLSALAAGTSKVTAALGSVTSPGFTVTVSSAKLSSLAFDQTEPTVSVGQTLQLTATGTFADGSTQNLTRDVAWSSGDTDIATVSVSSGNEGTVKGIAAGTVTLSATSDAIPTGSGTTVTAAADLTVQ